MEVSLRLGLVICWISPWNASGTGPGSNVVGFGIELRLKSWNHREHTAGADTSTDLALQLLAVVGVSINAQAVAPNRPLIHRMDNAFAVLVDAPVAPA